MSLTNQPAKQFLQAVASELANTQIPIRFAPADDERPYDVLLAGLELSALPEKSVGLELSFLPDLPHLQPLALLQFFAALPIRAEDGSEDELNSLILTINGQLPLVGFGHIADHGLLCFRHVQMLAPEEDGSLAIALETLWMIHHLLESFADPILAVARREKTVSEALASCAYSQLFDSYNC